MTTLADELKASIELESFLSKVESFKQTLPPATYRKLTQRLADLEEHEKCTDYANDINPETGHIYACGCERCQSQYGLAF